jgi:nucleoside-diphosphate-sugar epimerase
MATVLITGGAGFIGSNLANRLIGDGHRVTILDNLSRPGARYNLGWLTSTHGAGSFRLVVGGGPENTLSVWVEFRPILERLLGRAVHAESGPWRPGDQRAYVSDIRKAGRELDWRPRVGVEEGIGRLVRWVRDNERLFDHV